MKKISYLLIVFAGLCLAACNNAQNAENVSTDTGIKNNAVANSVFQVSLAGKQVHFSQGNLQYTVTDNGYRYRFADNQYDQLQTLFGQYIDYFNYTHALAAVEYMSDWRMLTQAEWEFLLDKYKHWMLSVNGVYGMMLLPEVWTQPSDVEWNLTGYTAAQWRKMQLNGAVFLPASGMVQVDLIAYDKIGGINQNGCYWSATANNYETFNAYSLFFNNSMYRFADDSKSNLRSVRLVMDVR